MRAYREADFDAVVAAWHDTNRRTFTYSPLHQQHTLEDARQFFRGALLAECALYVAEIGSERAGLIAIAAPWIRQLSVFPPFQRRGVGRALVRSARGLSPRELRAFTFAQNASARAFYESEGFSAVGFGISPPPESLPDVEYVWRSDA